MLESGILIINNDNDILNFYKKEFKRKVVIIGIENESNFRV